MICDDYEHFSFSAESNLNIVDVDVPRRSGLEGVEPFPLHYRLDRSGYRVEVKIDESSYGPAATIIATSGSAPVQVKMLTPTRAPETEQFCFSYREVGKQLLVSWMGGEGCEAVGEFQIAVHGREGDVQGIEVLTFDIVRNGRYCVEDGL